MKRFALALPAVAAAVAISPYAYAVPEGEELPLANPEPTAGSATDLQGELSVSQPNATITPGTNRFDETPSNNLNNAADIFNELPSENIGGDPAVEVILLDL